MERIDLLKKFLPLLRFYPPYWFTGIKVEGWVEKYTAIRVSMRLRLHNRNLFGAHFGGSLYAMCDPFYVLIVAANLGTDYVILDQAATIRFRRPGRGKVSAVFSIAPQTLENIKQEVHEKGRKSYVLQTEITDEGGKVVAQVEKTIYIRLKNTVI
ncbi:MAG: YiiD C-terminal domain-containing protein [Bacteroidota bacterium]